MRWLPILLFLSLPLQAQTPEPQAGALAQAVRHFHAQELEVAEALLLDLRQARPEDADSAYYLGRVYLAQGRSLEAVRVIAESARLDPESSRYQFWLGEALVERIAEVPALFKLGIAKRMRAAYEKAVELDPDNLEARVAAARYHSEAPPIAGGSLAQAQAHLDEIRRRDPALAHVAQGLIHEQLGRPEPAAEELAAAAEVDPESIVAWREAGLFYQRRQRWQDAQRAFDEVLARAPADPVTLYEAARTAITISEQQLERAEKALQAYLRLEPGPDPVVLSEGTAPRRAAASRQLAAIRQRQGRPDLVAAAITAPEPDVAGDEPGAAPAESRVWTGCPVVDATLLY